MTTYADPGARSPRPRRPDDEPASTKGTTSKPKKPKIAPLWAKLSIIIGAVVMVASGAVMVGPKVASWYVTKDIPSIDALTNPPTSIDGPINILLLGMDQRNGAEAEGAIRADSIVILHVPAAHDSAYLISIPRDSKVSIPAFPATNFRGLDYAKINAAFAWGATKNGQPDASVDGRERGATLTVNTINQLVPGGIPFNALAILNYDGFLSILKAIGGVYMCVDEDTYSIHYYPNGQKATHGDLPVGVGKFYPKDACYDMQPWEALDFARQRENLSDGDYGRQRHQQQLIKAIVKKMTTAGILTDLPKLLQVKDAAGELLTLDLGDIAPEKWLYTLSGLGADNLTMIKTNGGQFVSEFINGESYQVLSDDSLKLLQAVSTDTVLQFLTTHPDWVA